MLPQIVPMRISITEFWEMTPKEFNAVYKGYKLRMKIRDEEMYMQGLYNKIAYDVSLSHFGASLVGKTSKAEYLKQPFLSLIKDKKELTAEQQAIRDMAVWDMWAHRFQNSGLPPSPYE